MNENIFPNETGLVFALQILDKCLDAGAELADAFHTNPIDNINIRRKRKDRYYNLSFYLFSNKREK